MDWRLVGARQLRCRVVVLVFWVVLKGVVKMKSVSKPDTTHTTVICRMDI